MADDRDYITDERTISNTYAIFSYNFATRSCGRLKQLEVPTREKAKTGWRRQCKLCVQMVFFADFSLSYAEGR